MDVINIKESARALKESERKSAARVVQNKGWGTGVVPEPSEPGRASLVGPAQNRPPFIHFDHGGKRRKFQRARLQSASAAPPGKRDPVRLRDFCMLICCGGGERGRAVFQRNASEFARRAHGCTAR